LLVRCNDVCSSKRTAAFRYQTPRRPWIFALRRKTKTMAASRCRAPQREKMGTFWEEFRRAAKRIALDLPKGECAICLTEIEIPGARAVKKTGKEGLIASDQSSKKFPGKTIKADLREKKAEDQKREAGEGKKKKTKRGVSQKPQNLPCRSWSIQGNGEGTLIPRNSGRQVQGSPAPTYEKKREGNRSFISEREQRSLLG